MNDKDYLGLYGYIPWTITIADAFDAGLEWHRKDVAQALRNAQAEIDRLTAMTKEPTKLMAIPALMEAAGWVRKKEWVGLTDEEIKATLESVDPETKRLPYGFKGFALAIEAKLKEKNQ